VYKAYVNNVPVVAGAGNDAFSNLDPTFSFIPGGMPHVVCVGGAYPRRLTKPYRWMASSHARSAYEEYRYVHEPAESLPSLSRSRRYPDICGIVGDKRTRKLCLPVSPGLFSMVSFADKPPEGTPEYDLWVSKFSAVLLLNMLDVGCPLVNSCGDPTTQTDGWVVRPGGTSFATSTVAGLVALLLGAKPTLLADLGFPGFLLALRNACMDVGAGLSSEGDAAKWGIDVATGTGVLNAALLLGVD